MKEKYFDLNGDTVLMVVKYNEEEFKPKKGEAYIKGKFVYPYRGKFKDDEKKKKVGVYLTDDEKAIFIKPFGKNKRNKYKTSNIYDISLESIIDLIDNEGVKETDTDVIMGETDDIFAPLISDEDNPLQVLIKQALQDKQIDLKNYKNRFVDGSKMSNCKSALFKHGKMSMEKFLFWLYVLDLELDMKIKDKKGCANPMGQEHEYKNYK